MADADFKETGRHRFSGPLGIASAVATLDLARKTEGPLYYVSKDHWREGIGPGGTFGSPLQNEARMSLLYVIADRRPKQVPITAHVPENKHESPPRLTCIPGLYDHLLTPRE